MKLSHSSSETQLAIHSLTSYKKGNINTMKLLYGWDIVPRNSI